MSERVWYDPFSVKNDFPSIRSKALDVLDWTHSPQGNATAFIEQDELFRMIPALRYMPSMGDSSTVPDTWFIKRILKEAKKDGGIIDADDIRMSVLASLLNENGKYIMESGRASLGRVLSMHRMCNNICPVYAVWKDPIIVRSKYVYVYMLMPCATWTRQNQLSQMHRKYYQKQTVTLWEYIKTRTMIPADDATKWTEFYTELSNIVKQVLLALRAYGSGILGGIHRDPHCFNILLVLPNDPLYDKICKHDYWKYSIALDNDGKKKKTFLVPMRASRTPVAWLGDFGLGYSSRFEEADSKAVKLIDDEKLVTEPNWFQSAWVDPIRLGHGIREALARYVKSTVPCVSATTFDDFLIRLTNGYALKVCGESLRISTIRSLNKREDICISNSDRDLHNIEPLGKLSAHSVHRVLENNDHSYLKDTKAMFDTLNDLTLCEDKKLSFLSFTTMPMSTDVKNSIVYPRAGIRDAHGTYDRGTMTFAPADRNASISLGVPVISNMFTTKLVQAVMEKYKEPPIRIYSNYNHKVVYHDGKPTVVPLDGNSPESDMKNAEDAMMLAVMTRKMADIENDLHCKVLPEYWYNQQLVANVRREMMTRCFQFAAIENLWHT